MRRRLLALCLAACAITAGCAGARPGCPANGRDLPVEALYGRWEARFDAVPGTATVQLDKHPDYAGVRGTITRSAAGAPPSMSQLAGDVDDDGLLSIDESKDGRTITGVWLGELQAGSCGKQFTGTWRNAADESTHPFVMNKIDRLQ